MAYRVRWWMRTQWRSFLGLTVLVGVLAGVGLLLVGGAARTLTAADRYSEARGDIYDVSIEQVSGHPRIAELLALPSVTRVDSATFVFGGLLGRGGEPYDVLTFAGTHAAMGWRVVEGRAARTVGEAVVSRSFLEREGLSVGDEVDFVTFTQAQADAAGFDAPDPAGPSGRVRFVGALSGPADLEDGFAVAILPAAVLAEGDVGVSASVMAATLAEGASIDMLRAEMDDLPGGSDFAIAPAEWVSDDVRSAARTQGQGLLVVSAVVGVAALVVAGQVLSRQLRPSDPEQVALTAIGFAPRDRLMEPTVRALAVAAPALVLAGAVAFAGSGTFPVGFVELLEPRPGLRFDAPVIVGGVLVALVVLVGWVFMTAASESKRRPVVVEVGVVERISARVPASRSGPRSASRSDARGPDRVLGRPSPEWQRPRLRCSGRSRSVSASIVCSTSRTATGLCSTSASGRARPSSPRTSSSWCEPAPTSRA